MSENAAGSARHAGVTPVATESAIEPNPPRVADPLPLGIAGFAMTTFVLSCINAGFFGGHAIESSVFGLAIFYGGIAQFVAGMWEFANRNTFGAAAFGGYGAFWLSFWFLVTQVVPTLPTNLAGQAVGLYLLGWTIFTAYMTIASLRVTMAIFVVFALLTATYALLTAGELATLPSLGVIGGYVGIATALAAWYAAFASVTNSTFGKAVIPTGPFTRAA
jgi:succinate-acetate transporter protein